MFLAANVPTEPSGITVEDYPEDCDMYSQSLEASMQALQTYKDEFEESATFMKWIAE